MESNMRSIKIKRKSAKLVFSLVKDFNDNKVVLVCKGYDEDDDYYTGLYWPDDKNLDFSDDNYFDFQLWYSFKNEKRLLKKILNQ